MYNNLRESVSAVHEIDNEINTKIESSNQKKLDEANEMGYERDLIVESRQILNERNTSYKNAVRISVFRLA